MLDDLFRGWTPIIILAVVVLLFGATRLPALARSLGQSRNAFKSEMKKGEADKLDSTEAKPSDTTVAAADEATSTTPKP
jgi:sec-independent protein translocase protein TatA